MCSHDKHVVLLTRYAFCILHGKRVVVDTINTVSVLIFTRRKAIVSTVLSNTKEIFNEQNPNTVVP